MTNVVFSKRIDRFSIGCLLIGGILLVSSLFGVSQTTKAPAPIEDIRDIMVERPPASFVPVILTIVVLVVALVIGGLAFRRFMTRQPEVEGPPPEVIARNRLSEISKQVDELPPNKASLETSEAIKNFLTAQYKDPIRFETAEEYLTRITYAEEGAQSKLSPTLTNEVRSFMSISQELKFAQLKEARSRIPSLVTQAETLIALAVQESDRPAK